MVSLPIVRWTLGDSALVYGIIAGVLVQVVVVLAILNQEWGWRKTTAIALGIVVTAWIAEWIGSSSGFLFSGYDYTALLQPQILGVPYLIPLAWLMMLPPSWAIAAAILGFPQKFTSFSLRLKFIALSALAFTAWDFYLDPQMVAWGFWVWDIPGGYFGIPWENFLGWLVVSGIITGLFGQIQLPAGPLIIVYVITWILQGIGQFFFWELRGPAVIGFMLMGVMILLAMLKARTSFQTEAESNA
jgi:putative membrane protein